MIKEEIASPLASLWVAMIIFFIAKFKVLEGLIIS